MVLENLLTTYWPQTTLVFTLLTGVIGYFIKRFFDTKSKKIEINHTLYQQNRLTTVNRFFETYADAERLWEKTLTIDVFSENYNVNKMNELTTPMLSELDKNLFQLMIYFDEVNYRRFESLVDNLKFIHDMAQDNFFFYETPTMSVMDKIRSFNTNKNDIYNENSKIFYELSKAMKDTFNT